MAASRNLKGAVSVLAALFLSAAVLAGVRSIEHGTFMNEEIMRLMKEGYYLNAAVFPAVPLGDGGIRFAHTLHNTRDQITGLLEAISHHLPEVASDLEIVVDLRDAADVEANGPGPSNR